MHDIVSVEFRIQDKIQVIQYTAHFNVVSFLCTAMSADRRPPPEFVSFLPIRKTRAGLQFTCATATLGLNAHNLKDVWVCNRCVDGASLMLLLLCIRAML